MLKTHWKIVSRIARLTDNVVIVLAFFLAYEFRDTFLQLFNAVGLSIGANLRVLAPIQDYFVVLGFSIPLYNAVLSALGAYRSMRMSSYLFLLRTSIGASAISFLCLGALLYLMKIDLSRSFIGLFCSLVGVFLLLERMSVLALLRFFRAKGKNFRNILVVGTGEQARKLAAEIASEPELGLRLVGFVALSAVPDRCVDPVVADEETFESALKRFAVDEVLFTDVSRAFEQVEDLAQIASEEGVGVSLAADFFSLEILRSDVSYFGDTPLIHYQRVPADPVLLTLKRALDLGVSIGAVLVLSPLLLATAVAIRAESRGPVFFRQKRVGLNGRTFTLYKFRSMVTDAESLLPKLQQYNEMSGPVFKMANDPRVTMVGRFIRRFSIDELPQFFNVLKGDMSLVGPRPPLPSEVLSYQRKQRRRLSMRPGMTCTWQVSGRNNIPNFEEWAKLDLEYIDNWSLWRDLGLLLRTIPAVLIGSGAR